ncbi:MAG: hypothetical protein AAF675_00015 [Pseudomonadota bacterium]
MRVLLLSAYLLVTLPIVTVWAASSLLAERNDSLPFRSSCERGGVLTQSLLRGFCSFGGASNTEPAGDCLAASAHDAFAVIFNDIADEGLGGDAPDTRIEKLGTDGCAPDGAEDALVSAYLDLRDRVMNKLLGF